MTGEWCTGFSIAGPGGSPFWLLLRILLQRPQCFFRPLAVGEFEGDGAQLGRFTPFLIPALDAHFPDFVGCEGSFLRGGSIWLEADVLYFSNQLPIGDDAHGRAHFANLS